MRRSWRLRELLAGSAPLVRSVFGMMPMLGESNGSLALLQLHSVPSFPRSHRYCYQSPHRKHASFNNIHTLHNDEPTLSEVFSTAISDDIAGCWRATSWSVNPLDQDDTNELMGCFNSPAPQAYHAFRRALEESNDTLDVLQIFSYVLKNGFRFEMESPTLATSNAVYGGCQQWRIVSTSFSIFPAPSPENESHDNQRAKTTWVPVRLHTEFPHTLSIAHRLLDLAIDNSDCWWDDYSADQRQEMIDDQTVLEDLVLHRLRLTLGVDIRGRAAADTAFALAMAGVTRPELYEILTQISYHELKRIGPRPSFPSKYILQIVEKLAAAGVECRNDDRAASKLFLLAADLLRSKSDSTHHRQVIEALEVAADSSGMEEVNTAKTPTFGLHSTWPLLWIFRFAARQTKAVVPEHNADATHINSRQNWTRSFDDLSPPLVVDIGCGMGVSLLGLATLKGDSLHDDASVVQSVLKAAISGSPTFGDSCNFLGGDLSHLSINYARGIAKRRGIDDRVQFAQTSAVNLLKDISGLYPKGKVALIMIQFPTPFKLGRTMEGNQQLPKDEASGFMVTPSLLRLAYQLLRDSGGYLLLQSNCEDVAVKMRQMAVEKVGFECLDLDPTVMALPGLEAADDGLLPLRSQQWIQLQGERPVGRGWLAEPILPRKGFTETEVNCMIQGTPVHRCLLRVVNRDKSQN